MSAKVLKILKSKMSLKERQQFVANCNKQNPGWENEIHGRELNVYSNSCGLFHASISFYWYLSNEGSDYWQNIYDRFTPEERSTIIDNLNNLNQ